MGQADQANNAVGFNLEEALTKHETARAGLAQKRVDAENTYASEVIRLRTELFWAIKDAVVEVNKPGESQRLGAFIHGTWMELIYDGRNVAIVMNAEEVSVKYSDNPGRMHERSVWQLSINKPVDITGKPCELLVDGPDQRKQPFAPRVHTELLYRFLAGILLPPLDDIDDIPF